MRINIDVGSDGKPEGIVGKGCASVFFAIFALMGLGFTGVMCYALYDAARPYTWDKTDCVILESGVRTKPDKESHHWFEVKYAYRHKGERYESDVYEDGYSGSDDYGVAQGLADKYKVGGKAACYVNPSDPHKALLKRKSFWFGFILIVPLIFVAVGVGGFYWIWRGKKKRADGSEAPESISAKAKGKKSGPWAVVFFFGIFFAVGIGVFYAMFLRPMMKIEHAKGWPEVPCTVISSRVQSHEGDDSTTYSVDIFYSYTFDGHEYKSNRYSFMTASSSGYEGKKAVIVAHPKGRKTVCYVNPDDPAEAVLERGYTADMWFGLIPLVFVAVGAGGIFFTVRSHLRKKAKAERPDVAAHAHTGAIDREVPTGPVTLKPKHSPLGKLIGVTAFALVWNGLVSVFVWQVIKGWRTGQGEWFLTLFMIPFVLVGLGAIGGIVYYVLALFNPRPRLTLSSDAVPLGGAAELQWEFSGQVSRIGKFEILLEGREEATYRRGTDTVTDKNVFATLHIVETEDHRDMMI
ncbi:MAG: DUF3592 domain-containing protein, partial [Planctomycetota bacterium]